jgi:hypothetical protein
VWQARGRLIHKTHVADRRFLAFLKRRAVAR